MKGKPVTQINTIKKCHACNHTYEKNFNIHKNEQTIKQKKADRQTKRGTREPTVRHTEEHF